MTFGTRRAVLVVALAAGAFASLAGPPAANAADPRFGTVTVSAGSESGPAQAVFAPNTPKIFVRGQLLDVPSGSKVGADWIAVRVDGAPPDYRIDGTVLDIGRLVNTATFSLSKPDAGWPVGDYRVDLSINGKAAGNVTFKVGG